MGSTDYGTQIKSIGFYDPANSSVVNKRNVSVQERGIYSGGLVSMVSGNDVSLAALVCIIGDSNYQLRVETTTPVSLTLDSSNKIIVLRRTYTGSVVTDYMDVLAVSTGSVQTNDLVVGVGVFVGANLTAISYSDTSFPRTEAKVAELMLKVEASVTPSMTLRVRAGHANYGSTNLTIPNQAVVIDAADASHPRIDLVYLDSDGAIKKSKGTPAATPTAPDYSSKIVLAEVTVGAGVTSLTQAVIKDVRSIIGAGTNVSSLYPSMSGNGGKYMRVKIDETGFEYVYPTYAP